MEYYSNELQVTENTPPTIIFHDEDGSAVPVENSLQLFKNIRYKKRFPEMHISLTGDHGFSMALKRRRTSEWNQLLIEWLKDK